MGPSVPRAFPGSTVVCVGSGPSLIAADIALCRRAGARILTINNAFSLCPDADVVYAPDRRWWDWNPEALQASGLKFAFQIEAEGLPGVTVLQRTGRLGLETCPCGLRSGGHSGYAAINLAVHLGARRVLLLGYDHAPGADGAHHFAGGDHPDGSHLPDYEVFRDSYLALLEPLRARRIDVCNVSRVSTVTAFPRVTLEEALEVECFR